MVLRGLSGIYFKYKLDGKWTNVVFEDLPVVEQQKILKTKKKEYVDGLVLSLAASLKLVGEQFDIKQIDY
jgi:hypothetical protein